MTDEADAMSLMTSEYTLERSKLEASKAQILSEIQGAKNRIDVGMSEGSVDLVKAQINSHNVSQQTELQRLQTSIDKSNRDLERTKGYLGSMILRAPTDGVVNILSNFRSGFSGGQQDPPFKEGDSVWTGAAIAEIPDLSSMRAEVKLEEVDRGKIKLGQIVKIRVDAIPDKEFEGVVDWISPIAALSFSRGGQSSDKLFPAYATLKSVDPRLRVGMSASVDFIIESQPNVLLIPVRASFTQGGKPSVFVQRGEQFALRPIEVGRRNESEIVVVKGLREGELVTLEDPKEAAKRAKKKM
jgi:multidrug efflux pump subunit AcrA (membrane-fusion protein)